MASAGDSADLEPVDKGYKAPDKKTIQELNELDKEDESLQRYKEQLLGANAVPDDPRNFIPKCVRVMMGKETVAEVDLAKAHQDKTVVKLPEGAEYHVEVDYYVQREILSGLKYIQAVYKAKIKIDHSDVMLGSYAPKAEHHTWKSPIEEAPKGMMARGTYDVKSRFIDDDKQEYLCFAWVIDIVKSK